MERLVEYLLSKGFKEFNGKYIKEMREIRLEDNLVSIKAMWNEGNGSYVSSGTEEWIIKEIERWIEKN